MPPELTQRIQLVKGRKHIALLALRCRVNISEYASVESVRDESGANTDIAPLVGRPNTDPATRSEYTTELGGGTCWVCQMLKHRPGDDHINARVELRY
jgi:hypothetical protein